MRSVVLLFTAILLLGSGCIHYQYSPNFVQTPYHEKKGGAELKASLGGNLASIKGDFHASYSPIKHGTVMLNFFRSHSSFEESNFFNGTIYRLSSKEYLLEAAAGGYIPFKHGTAALYVGGGHGRIRNDYGIGRIAKLNIQRFFVQPTLTFKYEFLRLGMGLRVVMLNFPSGQVDYRIDQEEIDIIQNLERDAPFWIPELGGNIGVHIKPVTITANMVVLLAKPNVNYRFDYSNMGLGISLELEELFKKGKK